MSLNQGVMEAYLRLRESGSLRKLGVVEEHKPSVDELHSQTVDNLIKLKKSNSMQAKQRMSCPGRLE